jgi:hypothetical protein
MVISMSASTPTTALGSNDQKSEDLTALSRGELGTSLIVPRCSILFYDVCAAIEQGGCGGIDCDCGGLAWDRAYMLHGKYMCPDSHDGSCSGAGWHYCTYWSCVSWSTWQKTGHSALLHKGTPTPNCTLGNFTPVNFPILKPSDWELGCTVSIKINGKGYYSGTLLHLMLITINHGSSSYHVFHSFYEEI